MVQGSETPGWGPSVDKTILASSQVIDAVKAGIGNAPGGKNVVRAPNLDDKLVSGYNARAIIETLGNTLELVVLLDQNTPIDVYTVVGAAAMLQKRITLVAQNGIAVPKFAERYVAKRYGAPAELAQPGFFDHAQAQPARGFENPAALSAALPTAIRVAPHTGKEPWLDYIDTVAEAIKEASGKSGPYWPEEVLEQMRISNATPVEQLLRAGTAGTPLILDVSAGSEASNRFVFGATLVRPQESNKVMLTRSGPEKAMYWAQGITAAPFNSFTELQAKLTPALKANPSFLRV